MQYSKHDTSQLCQESQEPGYSGRLLRSINIFRLYTRNAALVVVQSVILSVTARREVEAKNIVIQGRASTTRSFLVGKTRLLAKD